jgi:hypothetical protein
MIPLRHKLLLCVLAFFVGSCVSGYAQGWERPAVAKSLPQQATTAPEAIIRAPEQVNIGDLVILDGRSSVGDNFLWVPDDRAVGRFIEFDNQLVFAIGTPGTYKFQLIAANTQAQISQVTHSVRIGPNVPGPDPKPDPDPDPKPDPQPSKLLDAVRDATRAVDDPTTAAALRAAFLALSRDVSSEALAQAANEARDTVLLKRSGPSQSKDWVTLWRKPVQDVLNEDTRPFSQKLDDIIKGLEAGGTTVTKTATETKRITVYTLDNCPPCKEWLAAEFPKLKNKIASGEVQVVQIKAVSGSVPRFTLRNRNAEKTVQGFASAETLLSLLGTM